MASITGPDCARPSATWPTITNDGAIEHSAIPHKVMAWPRLGIATATQLKAAPIAAIVGAISREINVVLTALDNRSPRPGET